MLRSSVKPSVRSFNVVSRQLARCTTAATSNQAKPNTTTCCAASAGHARVNATATQPSYDPHVVEKFKDLPASELFVQILRGDPASATTASMILYKRCEAERRENIMLWSGIAVYATCKFFRLW